MNPAWTPFAPASVPDRVKGAILDRETWRGAYMNSRYQVFAYDVAGIRGEDNGGFEWPPMTHLSIKTHDRSPIRDWRDLQRIKNELCGPEREGIELFPAESRLVDTANQFHLFVMPRGVRLPFGWTTRLVSETEGHGSRQRPWEPDARPADLVDVSAMLDALMPRGEP